MKIKISFYTSFSKHYHFFNFVKVVPAMHKIYDINKTISIPKATNPAVYPLPDTPTSEGPQTSTKRDAASDPSGGGDAVAGSSPREENDL